ncbi:hypothetical protein [Methanobrevibacter sp.]
MAHPHKDAISKMDAPALVGIIEESKMTYVRDNLSIHLHESQIKLLKNIKKHSKPHHAKVRVKQYEKAEKTDLFKLHLDLYLKKYQKLEKKGLIQIDMEPENGLPYDCSLTDKGQEILTEICYLEHDWAETVGITDSDAEVLKRLALDSFEISYKHKKKQGFIF